MSEPFSTERTYFSPGTRIEGTLILEGEVKLQGQIKGKISGTGVVTVGEQATLDADLSAPTVVVHGTIRGEVQAGDRLELHRTAKLRGKIRAPRMRIDEGAVFEGECKMGPTESAQPTRAAEPARTAEPHRVTEPSRTEPAAQPTPTSATSSGLATTSSTSASKPTATPPEASAPPR